MPCRWPVVCTQPNSRCSATNAGAELVPRARFFSLKTRAASWMQRTLLYPRLGPSGASTSPRIWICSINAEKFSVKRKTQNVVGVFVLRLFVVVLFLSTAFAATLWAANRLALHCSHPTHHATHPFPLMARLHFSFTASCAIEGKCAGVSNRKMGIRQKTAAPWNSECRQDQRFSVSWRATT